MRWGGAILGLAALCVAVAGNAARAAEPATSSSAPLLVKQILLPSADSPNLLAGAWQPYERGFTGGGSVIVAENGDSPEPRGAFQTVVLDQRVPTPLIATAESRAFGVSGEPDGDYSIYLDLQYADGTYLYGQIAPFRTGTHDWQREQVVVWPEKPVRQVAFYLLLRRHTGKAEFRDATLQQIDLPQGAAVFDGLEVRSGPPREGFAIRDAAAGGGFVAIEDGGSALDVSLEFDVEHRDGAAFYRGRIADTSGRDRAITLAFTGPAATQGASKLLAPDPMQGLSAGGAYRGQLGPGRVSNWPLIAASDQRGAGRALCIDLMRPACFRVGMSGPELYIVFDLGLTPQRPKAEFSFCAMDFDASAWGFRSAVQRMYELFPDAFTRRIERQGLWMPFAHIGEVRNWEDFGFAVKEGDDQTAWDDAHGILTFRYTEPMTWWMPMPKGMPRTMEAAVAEARRLAEGGNVNAKALLASGMHDPDGQFVCRFLDTPWCDGAVWSMNSSPGAGGGDRNDFAAKWNLQIRASLYGPDRPADLDGEYVDSSEGYVTAEYDYRRDHFATAAYPLGFDAQGRPAVFRGLVALEYVEAIERDVRAVGRLMMANGAPHSLYWLAPHLDVMGSETDWNYAGRWAPMPMQDLLFRRAMARGKPYCFLMNTDFGRFGPQYVQRYMKRCLSMGMFPGFFSADASTKQYFQTPELYERDRPLFGKYVPLCQALAQSGWEPVPLARSSDAAVNVERFGRRYLTALNPTDAPIRTTVTLEGLEPGGSTDLVSGGQVTWTDGAATLEIGPQDVVVLEVR